ncbi:MAG: alpha-1,4-glucan--maltose-1-phosphate maltosyltransferase [Acidimicrobiales bacterium]
MLTPILIDDVHPRTPSGFPAKAVTGQALTVSAVLVADGHDRLAGRVRWHAVGDDAWQSVPLEPLGNDRWTATIAVVGCGAHELVIDAWTDRYATWRHEVEAKVGVGIDVTLELEEGARLLEDLAARLTRPEDQTRLAVAAEATRRASCTVEVRLAAACDAEVVALVTGVPDARLSSSAPHPLWVDRPRAAHAAWYELFPRSFGGLRGAAEHLAYVADLGFDVVYLPPIHPIGATHRKGRDNTLDPGPDDPGSPWAIGSAEGGHDAVHPALGTIDDFDTFVATAEGLGLEVALDYALQCSPDHPWVHDHPEWFTQRPDGTIRYAENPPKKYQDIHPIEFWPPQDTDRIALWEACRDVLEHWIGHGVRTFRVDNPHTKPLAFWAWLIDDVHARHPEVVFLAEAFTMPAMMAKLAEVGFTQSYTYFTWRHSAWELRDYVTELTQGPLAEYMRPSFWPNTPDILDEHLRHAPPSAFASRLVLAATLVPLYGIYSGYELGENEPANDTTTEYRSSEKYELKARSFDQPHSIAPLVRAVNHVRRRHPDLWALRDVRFHHSDDERFLVYSRGHVATDLLLCVVLLDTSEALDTTVRLDLGALGLPADQPYTLHDELSGDTYVWEGSSAYVRLDPAVGQVAHLLHVTR